MKKWPGKKQETGSLEEVFRRGFSGAEAEPAAGVWERLDQQLQTEEAAQVRRQMRWYQYMAAASVLLLLLVIGGSVWYAQRTSGSNTATALSAQEKSAGTDVAAPTSTTETAIADNNLKKNIGSGQSFEVAKSQVQKANFDHFSEKEPENTTLTAAKKELAGVFALEKTKAKNEVSHVEHSGEASGSLALAAQATETATTTTAATEKAGSSGEVGVSAAGKHAGYAVNKQNTVNKAAFEPAQVQAESGSERDDAAVTAGAKPVFKQFSENQSENRISEMALMAYLMQLPDTLLKPAFAQIPLSDSVTLPVQLPARQSKWSVQAAYLAQHLEPNFRQKNAGLKSNNFVTTNLMQDNPDRQILKEVNNASGAFVHQLEVLAGYQVHKRWRVELGVQYAQQQYQAKQTYTAYIPSDPGSVSSGVTMQPAFPNLLNFDTHAANIYIDQQHSYALDYQFRYLGVPLYLSYMRQQHRWGVKATTGAALQVLINEIGKQEDAELISLTRTQPASNSFYNTWQVQAHLSAAVTYQLHENLQLEAGPALQYGLVSVLKENNYGWKGNPLTAGVKAGVTYQFNKRK